MRAPWWIPVAAMALLLALGVAWIGVSLAVERRRDQARRAHRAHLARVIGHHARKDGAR